MSLTSKDKDSLLKMLEDSHSLSDLKLVLQTLIVLEDFIEDEESK
ncbi:hypothetical protein AAXE64_08265 [Priestia megaterium]